MLPLKRRKLVEILGPPDANGICRCETGGKLYLAHRDQLRPYNDAAKQMLRCGRVA